MAIVKTSPPLKMTVGTYRDAALRHFKTCEILWRYVNLPNTSNLKNVKEDEILKNIYYLSGYVVECAVKYRYCTDCHSLNDTDDEDLWRSRGINLRNHFSFVIPVGSTRHKDKDWSVLVLSNLCSSTSSRLIPDYLKILGNVNPTLTLLSAEEVPHDMQASWEPTIRYHYETNGLDSIINKADIQAFFQATKTLLRTFSVL